MPFFKPIHVTLSVQELKFALVRERIGSREVGVGGGGGGWGSPCTKVLEDASILKFVYDHYIVNTTVIIILTATLVFIIA